ncbi:MAG: PKD domain-containing protein [Thermoplasmata archaeon]
MNKIFAIVLACWLISMEFGVIYTGEETRAPVPWWNTSYAKRIYVNITNPTSTPYNNVSVIFELNTSIVSYSSILPSGDDIVVVDSSGNVVNWTIVSWNTTATKLGVETSIPPFSNKTFWVYYNSTAPLPFPLMNTTNLIYEPWSNASDLSSWVVANTTNSTFAKQEFNQKLSCLNQTLVTESNPQIYFSVATLNVSSTLKTISWEINASLPNNASAFVSLNLNFSDGKVLRYISESISNYTDADLLNGTANVFYQYNLTSILVEHDGMEFKRFEVQNISSDTGAFNITSTLSSISIEFAANASENGTYSVFWNSIGACAEPVITQIAYGTEENLSGPVLQVYIPEENISVSAETLIFAGYCEPVYAPITTIQIINSTVTSAAILSEGLWYAVVNLATYSDGTYRFEVKATDSIGMNTSVFINVTKITGTANSIIITYPANNTKVNDTENCTGNVSNSEIVKLRVNGGTWLNGNISGTQWWASYNFSQHPFGRYFLIASAINSTQNTTTYGLSIVNHSTAPAILDFTILPVNQISDNDTFTAWTNITATIAFSAYLEYAMFSNFTNSTVLSLTYISGNTYYVQIPQKFDTLSVIYFRVKVVDSDNYVKYSSTLQRIVDKSYATGTINLNHLTDISQGATIIVNSSVISNTFGSPVVDGTQFNVWAEHGNINYISGPSIVSSAGGRISFYYTGTTAGNDTIHVTAVLGNASGTSAITVHGTPGIASYSPGTNLSVPSATVNVMFTNPMNESTLTTTSITTTYGMISDIQIVNATQININLTHLAYNRSFSIGFNVKDIYGGTLNQQISISTAKISGNIVLIPQAWNVDANASVTVSSAIIYDSGGNTVIDGTQFNVSTDLGYINIPGQKNATLLASAGKVNFTLIGENVLGVANVTIQVETAAGNASGLLQVNFADLSAPTQPKNLTATPNTWTKNNSFTLTWENPESLTPISKAYYKYKNPPASLGDYDGFEVHTGIASMTISLPSEGMQNVYVWLEDGAGNQDWTKYASVPLYYDASPPTITNIDLPQITTLNQVTAGISATDALSGVGGYYGRIYRNGTPPPAYTFSTTNTFQFTLATEGNYTFECYVVDNVGIASGVLSAYVIYDASKPFGNLTIVGKPYTNNRQIQIKINAMDNISGVDKMAFSINDPTFANSTWIDYAFTHTIFITGNDGTYRIYVKFRDFAGHESVAYYDEIVLDTTPPVNCTAIIENGARYTTNLTVSVYVNANDSLSGIKGVYMSWDPSQNGTWYNTTGNLSVTLSNQTEMLHTLYIRILDCAGNYATINASIYFDITKPTCVITSERRYTNSTTITLNLQATDNIGRVMFVRFAEDATQIEKANWENFSQVMQCTISEGDGEKTVYAQCKTELGEMSDVVSTTVVLDTGLPTLTILKPESTIFTLTDNLTYNITWNAFDNNGIAETVIYINSSSGTGWDELARVNTTYFEVEFVDNTSYSLKVRVMDMAGNSREKIFEVNVNINYEPVFVNASIPSDFYTDRVYHFSANYTDIKNDTLTYTWFVDNEIVGTGNTIEYVFKKPGTYTVKVVVTDGKFTLNKTWEVSVAQTVIQKGIMDYLPWGLPILLIVVFIVVVILLMKRKKKEKPSVPEEAPVSAESPGVEGEGGEVGAVAGAEEHTHEKEEHEEDKEMEGYGITKDLEKKIKAYVKQNPGVYLTKLASDFAAEYGMREVDVMTAVQMMEVDGNLTIQVDEEGRTRVFPP